MNTLATVVIIINQFFYNFIKKIQNYSLYKEKTIYICNVLMPWYMPRAWRIHNIKKVFITRFVI